MGVAGLNWDVELMPLKFLNANGSGTTADAIEALLYANANGADLTNNSWADAPFSQAMLDAINQADAAGSLFVARQATMASTAIRTPTTRPRTTLPTSS